MLNWYYKNFITIIEKYKFKISIFKINIHINIGIAAEQ